MLLTYISILSWTQNDTFAQNFDFGVNLGYCNSDTINVTFVIECGIKFKANKCFPVIKESMMLDANSKNILN